MRLFLAFLRFLTTSDKTVWHYKSFLSSRQFLKQTDLMSRYFPTKLYQTAREQVLILEALSNVLKKQLLGTKSAKETKAVYTSTF